MTNFIVVSQNAKFITIPVNKWTIDLPPSVGMGENVKNKQR